MGASPESGLRQWLVTAAARVGISPESGLRQRLVCGQVGSVLSTDVKLLVKAAARVGAVGGLRTAARVGVLCHRSPSGRRPEWGETAVGGP